MARWSLRGRLAAVVAAVLALTTLVLALAVVALLSLTRGVDNVTDRLFVAYSGTSDAAKAVTDQEAAVRGLVLTGERSFRDAYTAAQDRERSSLARARSVPLDARVTASLRRTEDVVAAWRSTYADAAVDEAAAGRRVPTSVVNRGRALFADVSAAYADTQRLILQERGRALLRIDDARRRLTVFVVALAVGLFASGLGVWVALRRWVVDPLADLGREIRQVAAGDVRHEIPERGPPEIRTLAGRVDAMRRRIVDEFARASRAQAQAEAASQQLAEQKEELERSNQELEQFAYVASHDLQEPLRKVASFCQLLERRYSGQLDERGEQYIAFAVDGAKRMQQLINDLLAFSRVGRLTTGFEPVSLQRCYEQALSNLEMAVDDAGAEITADELPTVDGEGPLLVQLLQNLLANAIKFRRPDVPSRVRVSVTRVGDEWEFACADNGIGIEPEYADKIFVIFQRLHRRDEYGGTGIGLALCRKIVEFHGGRIWLDADFRPPPSVAGSGDDASTAPGSGTVLRWTLPVSVPAAPGRDSAPAPASDTAPSAPHEPAPAAPEARISS